MVLAQAGQSIPVTKKSFFSPALFSGTFSVALFTSFLLQQELACSSGLLMGGAQQSLTSFTDSLLQHDSFSVSLELLQQLLSLGIILNNSDVFSLLVEQQLEPASLVFPFRKFELQQVLSSNSLELALNNSEESCFFSDSLEQQLVVVSILFIFLLLSFLEPQHFSDTNVHLNPYDFRNKKHHSEHRLALHQTYPTNHEYVDFLGYKNNICLHSCQR